MNRNYLKQPDGYRETIQSGIEGVRKFRGGLCKGNYSYDQAILKLKEEIETADAIVIGAGAGLSTSAGFTYSGERFMKYFSDFNRVYGFQDMYSGGFYPYPDEQTRWAFWARNIYVNRYMDPPFPVYQDLYSIVRDRDYFVITTNVDHCFQKAGFDKKKLFYTQGDYGLFQSTDPARKITFDNEEWVMKAMEAQGFVRNEHGIFEMPDEGVSMRIPEEMIPKNPLDGTEVIMNLRADESFAEDAGWRAASAAYSDFLRRHKGMHILYLELGVGSNTPVIIKYPFWQMTNDNPEAFYACLNYNEAFTPVQIKERSLCIDQDCGEVLKLLK